MIKLLEFADEKEKNDNMERGEEPSASYCFINYAFLYVMLAICNADF